MNVLWLDASAGMAGDMFVAAALDAGLVSLDELRGIVARWLPERVTLGSEVVDRSGMRARTFTVDAEEHSRPHAHRHEHPHEHEHGHRGLAEVEELLARCPVPPGAVERAREMFRILARAEAKVHGVPLEAIRFHEVGATDSLVDFALAAYVLEKSGGLLVASPAAVGRGRIAMQHGVWPVPPPGTAEVLREGGVPVRELPGSFPWQDAELLTPTGACLLRLARSYGDVPSGAIRAVGVGAGTKVIPGWPNVARLLLVETAEKGAFESGEGDVARRFDSDEVAVLETWIDDMPGNLLAETCDELLRAGALDCAVSTLTLRKGRVGYRLEVLAPPPLASALGALILGRTTTIGLRVRTCARWKLYREEARTAEGLPAKRVHDAAGKIARVAPETDALVERSRSGGPAPMFGWKVEDESGR